jgi:hypothetical protein
MNDATTQQHSDTAIVLLFQISQQAKLKYLMMFDFVIKIMIRFDRITFGQKEKFDQALAEFVLKTATYFFSRY